MADVWLLRCREDVMELKFTVSSFPSSNPSFLRSWMKRSARAAARLSAK